MKNLISLFIKKKEKRNNIVGVKIIANKEPAVLKLTIKKNESTNPKKLPIIFKTTTLLNFPKPVSDAMIKVFAI